MSSIQIGKKNLISRHLSDNVAANLDKISDASAKEQVDHLSLGFRKDGGPQIFVKKRKKKDSTIDSKSLISKLLGDKEF